MRPKPWFTSARERALWLWAVAAAVAIFSTLVLGSTLASSLRAHGLLAISFAAGMVLVGATIVATARRVRAGGIEIGLMLAVLTLSLMLFVRLASPAERTHLIEYGILAAFLWEALTERAAHNRRVPSPAVLAILAAVSIGVLDECLQAFIPGRIFDPRDILFNGLAAVTAVAVSVLLSKTPDTSG